MTSWKFICLVEDIPVLPHRPTHRLRPGSLPNIGFLGKTVGCRRASACRQTQQQREESEDLAHGNMSRKNTAGLPGTTGMKTEFVPSDPGHGSQVVPKPCDRLLVCASNRQPMWVAGQLRFSC